jgi:S-adenosylmethionine:tRNA ribosyltransferase-isomerase
LLRLADLDYDLSAGRIAQQPAARRDDARLLVVRRGRPDVAHAVVRDLPALLPPRTLLVVNDTRVFPARLRGARAATGGRCELLLVRRLAAPDPRAERWTCLLGTRGRPRPGERFDLGPLRATFRERLPRGEALVDLETGDAGGTVADAVQRHGAVPLPPYIRREPDAADRRRYQTVYARETGAVAAPTAGLHFTAELLDRLRRDGHEVVAVTLHVGPGTFRPIAAERPERHDMAAERVRVPEAAARAVCQARTEGRTVLAVGTTVVRALETAAADGTAAVRAFEGDTSLYVLPGHRFRGFDALLTNFHLPRTTLLALVMAFHGVAQTRAAYAEAIRSGYRFYSYGDAMLVLPEGADVRAE